MKSVRVIIEGRVQGVGFRDWLASRAEAAGLRGWVRNVETAQVEALLCGREADVDAVIAACRQGPRLARVDRLTCRQAPLPAQPGFIREPRMI